jgi:hypothetical protein
LSSRVSFGNENVVAHAQRARVTVEPDDLVSVLIDAEDRAPVSGRQVHHTTRRDGDNDLVHVISSS